MQDPLSLPCSLVTYAEYQLHLHLWNFPKISQEGYDWHNYFILGF